MKICQIQKNDLIFIKENKQLKKKQIYKWQILMLIQKKVVF